MDKQLSRKPRRLPTALAGAALGIGGLTGSLFLLGQTAGAEVAANPVATATADAGNGEVVEIDTLDGDAWAAFDGCLVDQGVLTEAELDEMYAEDWADEEWAEAQPYVAVESGDEVTFVDFGDGDGTVTISKVGDEITVTSDGDVTQETIDLDEEFFEGEEFFDGDEFHDDHYEEYDAEEFDPEFEAEMEAEFEAWDAAIDACEDLAPEGALEFEDGEFEDGELHVDDHDVDDHEED